MNLRSSANMKNSIIFLLLVLLPALLFSDTLKPSYYLQTDNTLLTQTIIENEKVLFSHDATLLREAIQPNATLWVKDIQPNHYLFNSSELNSVTRYKNQQQILYRIQNPSLSLLVDLESLSQPNTKSSLIAWISGNAFYYGAMFLLLLCGWFFYSLVRHKSFRYYLYFHFSFVLLLFDIDGWLQKIVLSNTLLHDTLAIPLGIAFTMFLMILFTRRLLATEQISKPFDRLLIAFGILNILSMLLVSFASYEVALFGIATLAFVSSILLLLGTLYMLLSGKSLSQQSHLLIWSLLLAAIGAEYLREVGILPSNLFTLLLLKATLLLELLIISASILLHRFSYLEKEEKNIDAYKKESDNKLSKNERDKQRLQQKHDLLNKLSGTDSLTGLYNRREFFNLSESLIFGAKNTMSSYSLMMLDLDHFKNINDTYGHDVGDIVLKEVTKAIDEHKRSDDIFGRIGGEEFAIFMPNTDAKEAEILADEICTLVGKLKIETETQPISITVSIGVTSDINYKSTLSELMKSSDIALYEAKGTGRNCVVAVDVLPR